MERAKSLTDALMDCVDRLGHESVDPRVWDHLLVYAPSKWQPIETAPLPKPPEDK